ncbi:hypothetical protein B1A99_09960 [Cohnella sp. CIP 111063]|uniref:GRAM domain-containing protein n=1 Tax=unclassified Cohnella TaxID=2636738 RepID=UPI000B8BDD88|nr:MULTISPECIES: GRAM domain-containing protein [unclassified Cohnella]OXS59854.1 hypothetical protein B1A99_09960 [Cohnella sp. CIP 111063]PRX72651.1 GRAM domain-containing protein [Cohnella sp. SGD-V74]
MSAVNTQKVLVEKKANLFRGIEAVGGTLTVTSDKLIFQPHAVNIQSAPLELPLGEIERADKRNSLLVVPNGMKVTDRSGKQHKFVLWGRDEVIAIINEAAAKSH